jgi:hypothetical protein
LSGACVKAEPATFLMSAHNSSDNIIGLFILKIFEAILAIAFDVFSFSYAAIISHQSWF